ncbi:hypothetical protein GUITHDRAFT_117480 [Guillardia theta CCMP2712]|uniref:Uncharacterized protein n=1 Tax=Guillardia theta (strain CCMP2712) TaxID=905079 RepID=L1IKQ0_GUITC|nr:hypothetical protein GUITHDRAFT_117480 [Guillardia theta CCMP2712]EKX36370.1 hypothetical protein GUITHDRAFT_117480 [Guillardia theta CCMP2712]|eukprot:XP_005823350.1 hypothetical protein GUITHDRAFT_117480 [Guillardia theta CCMP2712]
MIVIIYLVQCFGLIDLRKVLCFRACLGRPREHVSSSKPSGSDLNSTDDSTHTDNLESFKDFGVEDGLDKGQERLRGFLETDSGSERNESFSRPMKSELQQEDIFPKIPPRQPMASDLSQGSDSSFTHMLQPKLLDRSDDAESEDDMLNLLTLARKKSLLPDQSRLVQEEPHADLHGSLYSPTAESDYKSMRTESTASGDYHPLRDAVLERLEEEGGEDAESDVYVLSKMHASRGRETSTLNESVQTDCDAEFDEQADLKSESAAGTLRSSSFFPKTHELNLRIIRAQLSKMKDLDPPDRVRSSPRTVESRGSLPRGASRASDVPSLDMMPSTHVRRNRTTSPRAALLLSDQLHALYWAATSGGSDSRPGTHRLVTPRQASPLTDSDSRRSQTLSRADMLAALASRVLTPRSAQSSARGPAPQLAAPSEGLEGSTPRSGSMHWSQIAEENQRSQRSERSSKNVFVQSQMSRQRGGGAQA